MGMHFTSLNKSGCRQMNKLKILVYLLIISLDGHLVGFGVSSASCVVCPKAIVVEQRLAAKPDSNWESIQEDVRHQLMSITIFDGHPTDGAALVPDASTEEKGRMVYTWRLSASKTRRYWIACAYDRTNIMLIRPLDPDISICEITYDPQITIGGHPSVLGFDCK